MANLESLSVKCIYTHTKLDSQLTRQADNYVWLLLVTDLVNSLRLAIGCNPKLQEVSMDGMLFEPGQLLRMVQRRKRLRAPRTAHRAPLRKLRVRCARMAFEECKALKETLEFEHIRIHQTSYKVQTNGRMRLPLRLCRGILPGTRLARYVEPLTEVNVTDSHARPVCDLDPVRTLTSGCTIM